MISFLLTLVARLRPSAPSLKRVLRLGGFGVLVLGSGLGSAQTQLVPAGTVVAAARPATVGIALTQAKVVKSADGRERFLDPADGKPGDVSEYCAVHTNSSDKAVTGVLATLLISEDLVCGPRSASPSAGAGPVQAATKDGVFAAEPLMRQVQSKSEPFPYADYRALRWNSGSLGAKAQALVSTRVAVEVFVPVTVPPIPGVAAGAVGGAQAPSATALTASASL